MISLLCYFFFFSSRRRHTRCALVTGVQTCALPICCRFKIGLLDKAIDPVPAVQRRTALDIAVPGFRVIGGDSEANEIAVTRESCRSLEIGRASCRERVCQYV